MASKNPKAPARMRAAKPAPSGVATSRRRTVRGHVNGAAAPDAVDAANGGGDASGRAPADAAEHIRMRAYFLHLERRGRPGNPMEDWLAAERELRGGDAHDA